MSSISSRLIFIGEESFLNFRLTLSTLSFLTFRDMAFSCFRSSFLLVHRSLPGMKDGRRDNLPRRHPQGGEVRSGMNPLVVDRPAAVDLRSSIRHRPVYGSEVVVIVSDTTGPYCTLKIHASHRHPAILHRLIHIFRTNHSESFVVPSQT